MTTLTSEIALQTAGERKTAIQETFPVALMVCFRIGLDASANIAIMMSLSQATRFNHWSIGLIHIGLPNYDTANNVLEQPDK